MPLLSPTMTFPQSPGVSQNSLEKYWHCRGAWALKSTLMPYNFITVTFLDFFFFFYISKMVMVIVPSWFHERLSILRPMKLFCLMHVNTYGSHFVREKAPVFLFPQCIWHQMCASFSHTKQFSGSQKTHTGCPTNLTQFWYYLLKISIRSYSLKACSHKTTLHHIRYHFKYSCKYQFSAPLLPNWV